MTAVIKRGISSVKSAELFALDYGAGQLCHLKELYRQFLVKPDNTEIDDRITDNYRLTQICSTYHRQNEPTLTRQC